MNKTLSITCFVLLLLLFSSCEENTVTLDTAKPSTLAPKREIVNLDTTPKVTGIGGIFFFSKDPQKTKQWYAQHLGLAIDEYGSPFEFRNANRPEEINYFRWSPFPEGNSYFLPSKKEFMINYRVQNIDGLLRQFKQNGVNVLDSIDSYDYGKFLHIMDADGNKIELWEPVDSVFTKRGTPTTK